MICTEARRMMDQHMQTARTTESEKVAETNISIVAGMIGYALVCGHINQTQHSAEWAMIRLIRDERSDARLAIA